MKRASLKAIINYSDIPIPQFVDIILSGDDEAMYYLLHERMNHLFYLRFQDYSHNLYDEFDDVLDDFFIYPEKFIEASPSLSCISFSYMSSLTRKTCTELRCIIMRFSGFSTAFLLHQLPVL